MSNQQNRLDVLFPVGRMVQGSMYKAQDKDFEGRPRVYNDGPKKGQPKISYFFAIALPKTPGAGHWASEAWGQPIWNFGHAAWPQGQGSAPTFAWKIEDGDSAVPNKSGRKNCDREGFPGHWIVNFSSGQQPKLYSRDSSGRAVELMQPDAVKPGYFIQVQGSIASNETQGNPGIYINHGLVMLSGYGAEIRQGPDANAVQWAAALPPGASAVPLGGAPMPSVGAPGAPGAVPPPVVPPPVAAPAPAPAAAPTPVTPSASFMAAPPPGVAPLPAAAPPAPAAPPVAAGPQMTAKATTTYAQYIAAGWIDAQLRAQGLMV